MGRPENESWKWEFAKAAFSLLAAVVAIACAVLMLVQIILGHTLNAILLGVVVCMISINREGKPNG
jgi:hypothetical protein